MTPPYPTDSDAEIDEILRTLLRQGFDLGKKEHGIYGGYKEIKAAKQALLALKKRWQLEARIETAKRILYRGWCIPEMETQVEDFIATLQAQLPTDKEQS